MPPEAQTRLLRVLQEGEFTTVGGRTPIRADVRIVAATHRDLRQLIRQGLFREDLFYRLNVVPIRLPPLRERTEDIPALVAAFPRAGARRRACRSRSLDAAAMERLKSLSLAGQCARAGESRAPPGRALCAGGDRRRRDRGRARRGAAAGRAAEAPAGEGLSRRRRAASARLFRRASSGGLPPAGLYDRVLREIERPLHPLTLGATRGNQIKAAQLLGINRNTLRKKIRELDIEVRRGLK